MNSLYSVIVGLAIFTMCMVLVYRIIYKDTLKKSKNITKKITAKIISESNENSYEMGLQTLRYANYEFFVDSKLYHGFGVISNLFNAKTTTILYNPENPNENITKFEKNRATGKMVISGMIFAVFIIIVLPVLLMFLFL